MSNQNDWYVITGGPHSGKSKLVKKLSELGYQTLSESARIVIDESIEKGIPVEQLRANEITFQHTVLQRKIKLEGNLDPAKTIFLDRAMHDTLAYLIYLDAKIDPGLEELVRRYQYKKVFLLDIVPGYEVENDYARTENSDTAAIIDKLLYKVYTDYGMEPIRIPVLETFEDRVNMILNMIEQKN